LTKNFSHEKTPTEREEIRRADVNRARKIQAVSILQGLLARALDPRFTGTVGVEISAKAGNLGPVKRTLVEFPED
jgi:hypothetical protein